MMDEIVTQSELQKPKVAPQGGGSPVYGIGMIGAWVYYISRANTPRDKFLGFLKGLVWPAYLVHDLLIFLNKDQ